MVILYLSRIHGCDLGAPLGVCIFVPHYQWRTWDRIGLSSFPVFHSKLTVELGLESRSPNLGDFSISSDHVRLSSFFHKIFLTWHMPSVLFYNRCFEGGADGLFPSPSQPLTPESRIMSEMVLTALFPQRSTSPSAHSFPRAHLSHAQENTVLTVPFLMRLCHSPWSFFCHACSCPESSWIFHSLVSGEITALSDPGLHILSCLLMSWVTCDMLLSSFVD